MIMRKALNSRGEPVWLLHKINNFVMKTHNLFPFFGESMTNVKDNIALQE